MALRKLDPLRIGVIIGPQGLKGDKGDPGVPVPPLPPIQGPPGRDGIDGLNGVTEVVTRIVVDQEALQPVKAAIDALLEDFKKLKKRKPEFLPTGSFQGNSPIQFKDEGVNLGPSGDVDALNFTGTGVTATRVGNTVTVDITAGGGGYTDEQAQDAVGGILVDTATIDFNYNDVGNQITADTVPAGILAQLLTVDGPGSGLDADTLDGFDSSAFASAGSIPIGANPTALVGLTPINGVATTFLRSDGAPALDQGIAPVWTGIHRFANNRTVFSPNSDWDFTLSQENPNIFSERFIKCMTAATTSAPTFKGVSYGSLGTRAAPAAAINGDGIVSLDGNGFDGTAFRTQAFIRAFATETWTNGAGHGSYWNIATTQPGVVNSRTVAAITQDGHLQLILDNSELQLGLGTGSLPNKTGDLRLFHDGTNSIIRNDTGELRFFAGATQAVSIDTTGTQFLFGAGTAATAVLVNGAAGTVRDFSWLTGSSVRWNARVTSTAETGANAGSDWELRRRTDAGADLGVAIGVIRATGAVTIPGALTAGSFVVTEKYSSSMLLGGM